MNKKQIIISMCAVILVAIGLLAIKLNTRTDVAKDKIAETTIKKQESLQEETEDDLEQQNIADETKENETNITNESKDESGREVTDEDIQAIEIEIVKMKDAVKEQIGNMEAFEFAIKDFFYTFGIVEKEVICMNEVSYLYETNEISFLMYVSNGSFTYFEVVYDMETGTYKVPVMEE